VLSAFGAVVLVGAWGVDMAIAALQKRSSLTSIAGEWLEVELGSGSSVGWEESVGGVARWLLGLFRRGAGDGDISVSIGSVLAWGGGRRGADSM
jgi:hypothetical protein